MAWRADGRKFRPKHEKETNNNNNNNNKNATVHEPI